MLYRLDSTVRTLPLRLRGAATVQEPFWGNINVPDTAVFLLHRVKRFECPSTDRALPSKRGDVRRNLKKAAKTFNNRQNV